MCHFLDFFILRKCTRNLVLRDRPVCTTYCIPQLISVQVITKIRSDEVQSISLLLIMENFLPFTDDVMVVLVHKCCATDTPLGIALRNIRIHSASFECIKWFSMLPDNR